MFKTLKISEPTHFKLKIYCTNNKLKLNKWVEKLILESIPKHEEKSKNRKDMP
jgi:hypothetical protein